MKKNNFKFLKISGLSILILFYPFIASAEIPSLSQAIPAGYVEVKHLENGILPSPNPEDIEKGYMIFVRENMEGVYPNSIPNTNELSGSIKLTTTPGEYEPASFSIFAIRDLAEINVFSSDLVSTTGRRISKNNVEIKAIFCWLQKVGEYDEKKAGIIPELLEDLPVKVKKGTSKQFWAIVRVPETASAGTYKGNIIVQQANYSSKVNIELEVLPYFLLKPPFMYWGVFSDYVIDDTQLKDLASHGLDTVCGGHLWAHAPPRPILDSPIPNYPKLREGKLDVDSLRIGARNSFEAFKKAGLRGQYIVALGWVSVGIANTFGVPPLKNEPMFTSEYTEDVKRVYGDFIDTIREESQNANVNTYFWGVDEPGTHPYLQKVALNEYPFLKQHDVKTFLTCDIEFTRVISRWIDARCYHPSFLFRDEATYEMLRDETKKAGAELWAYTGLGGTPSFYAARYRTGLLSWKAKVKTLMIFAYNSSRGDPYNDFDGPEPDYCLVYPPKFGGNSISTIQWEGVREGIDDAKYIYTLTEYIRRCKLSQNPKLIEAAKAANQVLEGILENIRVLTDYHTFEKYSFDYRNFNKFKLKIAEQTINLKNLLEEEKQKGK